MDEQNYQQWQEDLAQLQRFDHNDVSAADIVWWTNVHARIKVLEANIAAYEKPQEGKEGER